ncbi:hypothetical protein IG631_11208 [Alternaria alternata]|nr:hypothetical protein IG631_11208 [Alternaria alternata]
MLFKQDRQAKNPTVSDIDRQAIQPLSQQPSEIMAHKADYVQEMPSSQVANLQKLRGRG